MQINRLQIKLIAPKIEFAEMLFQWRNEPSTKRHNPIKPMTLEDCRKGLFEHGHDLKNIWEKPDFRWFVEYENQIVGNVSLKQISKMMLTAEIGYGIGDKFHGKGIGTAAVKALVNKVFQETELRKLTAYVHDQNLPSLKLLDRIGFKREGLLREHFIINGKPENEVIFGLLRHEWQPGK